MTERASRRELGDRAERAAERFLRERGYRILGRNFRCAAGEADLIAEQQEVLVFVEVKARTSDQFGPGREAVGPRKRRTLSHVAEQYCKQRRISDRSIRFDIVEVELDEVGRPGRIEVVAGAFGAPPARPAAQRRRSRAGGWRAR